MPVCARCHMAFAAMNEPDDDDDGIEYCPNCFSPVPMYALTDDDSRVNVVETEAGDVGLDELID